MDCITRQESANARRDEVLRGKGLRVDDPAEKKILVRPLEAGPLVADIAPSIKLGPTQEVTDYAAGIKRRKLEVRMAAKRVSQEDARVAHDANLEAIAAQTAREQHTAIKARRLMVAAAHPLNSDGTDPTLGEWQGDVFVSDILNRPTLLEGPANLYQELEIIELSEVEVRTHPSHKRLVYCGGFVGCLDCGRVGSTHSGPTKGISSMFCSGKFVQSNRHRQGTPGQDKKPGWGRPAQKLLRGKHPYPDGER